MRRLTPILALPLLLLACAEDAGSAGSTSEVPGATETASPTLTARNESPPLRVSPEQVGFVVHEWGTFTSLQSATGATMPGLHHEDEPLPEFVIRRDPDAQVGKGIEALPEPVTQKLETPVLYFYSDEPRSVRIDVAFPEGVISEWYPAASGFGPAVGELTALADGTMSWEAELVPGTEALLPVPEDSVWAPSRRVAATPVRIADQAEQFIFYRGLGAFDMPVRIVWADLDRLVVANQSDEDIPAAFLIRLHEGGGGIDPLGAIPAGTEIELAPSPKERDIEDYIADASQLLRAALEDTGLYADEAQAMVDTWTTSYFRTPGIRVLYIVPRSWTDALLPITIEPQPDELVRTLVGRIEVVTRTEELSLAAEVQMAAAGETIVDIDALGRFAEARLRTSLPHIEDAAARAYCQALIDEAAAAP